MHSVRVFLNASLLTEKLGVETRSVLEIQCLRPVSPSSVQRHTLPLIAIPAIYCYTLPFIAIPCNLIAYGLCHTADVQQTISISRYTMLAGLMTSHTPGTGGCSAALAHDPPRPCSTAAWARLPPGAVLFLRYNPSPPFSSVTCTLPPGLGCCLVPCLGFNRNSQLSLSSAIGIHVFAPFEALPCVRPNNIPLGCSLHLPVTTIHYAATSKADLVPSS
jgi:hypothetical protein